MPWPVTTSRTVYENRWIEVVEDTVVRPDGGTGPYGVVTVRHPSVFVVALTDDDEILLVTVDRHTVGSSVEVPAGGSDGEDLELAARRELLEETGFTASSWQLVGTMTALNGICRAPEAVFLARGLAPVAVDEDDAHADAHADTQAEEGITAVRAVPVADVLELVRSGGITDGETVAALMYALLELGRVR